MPVIAGAPSVHTTLEFRPVKIAFYATLFYLLKKVGSGGIDKLTQAKELLANVKVIIHASDVYQ